MEDEFNIKDIQDIRIIIVANGKRYALTPKKELDPDVCRDFRITIGTAALLYHRVVLPSLDDLKKQIENDTEK